MNTKKIMKKKVDNKTQILMMTIVFVLLVIFAAPVFAKMIPYSSDGYNYDVEIYMEKGWNLILMPDLAQGIHDDFANSEVQLNNIEAAYLYIPKRGRYYEMYPNSDELMSISGEVSQDFENFLGISSAWVYSNTDGYLRYKRVDVPKYNQVKLYRGWNFLTLTPELKMKKLGQIKGNCKISKLAFWQHQEWNVLDKQTLSKNPHPDTPSNWDDLILADSDSDIGKGILFKVSSACQLGGSSFAPPMRPY